MGKPTKSSKSIKSSGNGSIGNGLTSRPRACVIQAAKKAAASQSSKQSSSGSSGVNDRRHNSSGAASTSPAPSEAIDPSQVNFKYDIRMNGFYSLCNIVKKSTEKVRRILTEECDIILECRKCRNLFRSFPNYISHKETYCTAKFHPAGLEGFSQLIPTGSSGYQVQHHFHSSLADRLQEPKVDTDVAISEKASRLEQILSRLGPRSAEVQSPSSYNSLINGETNDEGVDFTMTDTKLNLLIESLRGRQEEGIVFQRRIKSDPSICDTRDSNKEALVRNDTAVLDGEGKVMFVGGAGLVDNLISRVVAQIEEKNNVEHKRLKKLNCPMCQTIFESEKSLRIHSRTHIVRKKTPGFKTEVNGADVKQPMASDVPKTSRLHSNPKSPPRKVLLLRRVRVRERKSLDSFAQMHALPCQDPQLPDSVLQLSSSPSSKQSEKENDMEDTPSDMSEGDLPKSLAKREANNNNAGSVIPFMPTSPIFAFKSGRATNNSFSACLSSVSSAKLLSSESPIKIADDLASRLKRPSPAPRESNKCTKTTGCQSPKRSKKLATSAPTSLTCVKCGFRFLNMSRTDICTHLAQCAGCINFSHVKESKSKSSPHKSSSSIQLRNNYPTKPSIVSPSPISPTSGLLPQLYGRAQLYFKQNGRHSIPVPPSLCGFSKLNKNSEDVLSTSSENVGFTLAEMEFESDVKQKISGPQNASTESETSNIVSRHPSAKELEDKPGNFKRALFK